MSGGTSTCTYDLMTAIHKTSTDIDVDLLTPDICSTNDTLMGLGEDWIKVVPNDYKTQLAFSHNLSSFLKKNAYDVYHTNGLWMHINHVTCLIARQRKKPYIITPHGMLYPETLARSAWKKWPMRKIWFNKDIHKASCIHVTCQDEMNHIRNLGYNGPIALIGNPVNIPDFTQILIDNRSYKLKGKIKIAFLGRLHPRKNVENILKAVSLTKGIGVEVFIMGKGDEDYEEFLKSETIRLQIQNHVHFLGFVNGRKKFEKLSEMDTLFVPSDMENFGMIIPEALIVGTPVMASLGTPWKILNDQHCGWWGGNTPEDIAKIINLLADISPNELRKMGLHGRNYIIQEFSSNKIATEMLSLYSWIGGNIPKPTYVYTL